jgi:hypothetical protein
MLRPDDQSRLIPSLCHSLGISENQFKTPRRGEANDLRRAFIFVGRQHLKLSSREIGALLGGLSVQAISKQYLHAKAEMAEERGASHWVQQMTEALKGKGKP